MCFGFSASNTNQETTMFDINQVEKEAQAELAEEASRGAKGKIKESLRKIAAAEKVLANLRAEHAELMKDIGTV
jgi:glucan biosynthesis protein